MFQGLSFPFANTLFGGGGISKLSGQTISSKNLGLIKQLSDMLSPVSCGVSGAATETFRLCDA